MHTGTVEWFEPMNKKIGAATEFSVDGLDKLPRVDIIYAHANMSADLIDAAVRNGAKGIVVAGVGDGNMTTPALEALQEGREGGRRRGAQHSAADGTRRCATTRSTTTRWASSPRVN